MEKLALARGIYEHRRKNCSELTLRHPALSASSAWRGLCWLPARGGCIHGPGVCLWKRRFLCTAERSCICDSVRPLAQIWLMVAPGELVRSPAGPTPSKLQPGQVPEVLLNGEMVVSSSSELLGCLSRFQHLLGFLSCSPALPVCLQVLQGSSFSSAKQNWSLSHLVHPVIPPCYWGQVT